MYIYGFLTPSRSQSCISLISRSESQYNDYLACIFVSRAISSCRDASNLKFNIYPPKISGCRGILGESFLNNNNLGEQFIFLYIMTNLLL